MERRLIGEQVEFSYSWDRRCWIVNGIRHREDGGPAYEYMKTGYCEWYKYGRFVRNSHGASADWAMG